jgi:hypothetical protein
LARLHQIPTQIRISARDNPHHQTRLIIVQSFTSQGSKNWQE